MATDLQVLTLTPTSATIAWVTRRRYTLGRGIPHPVLADTRLWLGGETGPMRLVHDDPTRKVSHLVEVTGLEPGRSYRFRAASGDQTARPSLRPTLHPGTAEQTGSFRTPLPPAGRYLATVIAMNDIHIGERRQGIVLGTLPTSVGPDGDVDYSTLMVRATLAEVDQRYDHPFVMVNGDITYDNTAEQVATAHRLLTDYGAHQDWLVTRGNHDHPHRSGDPFSERFTGYQRAEFRRLDWGLGILGIDSTRGSGGGFITAEQFDQIGQICARNGDQPLVSLAHHPVTRDAAWHSPSGPQFMLRSKDRRRLQRLHLDTPGALLHLSGHTHRMRRNRPDAPSAHTHYLETAACAAFPGGYTAIHLFSGGYLVNYHRPVDAQAADWLYLSRWQSLGIGAHLMLGRIEDRNHQVAVDLSGLCPSGQATPEELRGL